ncbi:Serine/threonine-protein kinase TAO1 [Tyrophagus putrescentiae]|nr:Serine/threonine-protein kinase TAO1 [Tyrophagus putrescentiae]
MMRPRLIRSTTRADTGDSSRKKSPAEKPTFSAMLTYSFILRLCSPTVILDLINRTKNGRPQAGQLQLQENKKDSRGEE